MIRVLLADDHELVRGGLAAMLAIDADIEIIASVADSAAAIEQALRLQPDVAVVDFLLPPGDGVAVAQALLVAHSPTRGAIHKRSDINELLAAIRTLVQGDLHFCDTIAALRPLRGDGESADQQLNKLTSREREILRHVAAGAASASIAPTLVLQYDTVRTHRRNLMRKLELNNTAQLTALAQECLRWWKTMLAAPTAPCTPSNLLKQCLSFTASRRKASAASPRPRKTWTS